MLPEARSNNYLHAFCWEKIQQLPLYVLTAAVVFWNKKVLPYHYSEVQHMVQVLPTDARKTRWCGWFSNSSYETSFMIV